MTQVPYYKTSFEANPNEPWEEAKVEPRESRATQTQRFSIFRRDMSSTFAVYPQNERRIEENSSRSPRRLSILRSSSALLGVDKALSPSRNPERSITHIPKMQFITLGTRELDKKRVKHETSFNLNTTLKEMKTQIELGEEIDDGQTVIMSETGQDIRVKFILDKKRIVAIKILNFVVFLILVVVVLVQYFAFQGADIYKGDSITKSGMYNPFELMRHVDVLSWVVLLFFFFLFSTMPLLSTRDNYDLLLYEKIKYRFVVLALLLAGFTIAYSFGAPLSSIWVTPVLAFILKCYEYFLIYNRIKYHDDGHDFVSRLEFVCLHLTFSFCSAWLTYITVFSTFNSMSFDSHEGNFLGWSILNWEKLFQVLIFSEACINLACYKDVFFALMMALVFIGQYLRGVAVPLNSDTIAKDCDGDKDCIERFQFYEGQRSESLALGFFIVLMCFILLLFASNFRSVFYLKYNVLMSRLTKMKPKLTSEKQQIREKRRASQRPVPMQQLVRLVPNQALLRSSSMPEDHLNSNNKGDFLTVMTNADRSKQEDTFDISEDVLYFSNTQGTQPKFGLHLKSQILDIINEKEAHHARYVGIRRKTKKHKRVGSMEESDTMRFEKVSRKIHFFSEGSALRRPVTIEAYTFHPEYMLERGKAETGREDEVGIFESCVVEKRGKRKAYDI